MSPSAILDTRPTALVATKKTETDDGHVHGAQGLTPLQAVAHGGFTLPGRVMLPFKPRIEYLTLADQ